MPKNSTTISLLILLISAQTTYGMLGPNDDASCNWSLTPEDYKSAPAIGEKTAINLLDKLLAQSHSQIPSLNKTHSLLTLSTLTCMQHWTKLTIDKAELPPELKLRLQKNKEVFDNYLQQLQEICAHATCANLLLRLSRGLDMHTAFDSLNTIMTTSIERGHSTVPSAILFCLPQFTVLAMEITLNPSAPKNCHEKLWPLRIYKHFGKNWKDVADDRELLTKLKSGEI